MILDAVRKECAPSRANAHRPPARPNRLGSTDRTRNRGTLVPPKQHGRKSECLRRLLFLLPNNQTRRSNSKAGTDAQAVIQSRLVHLQQDFMFGKLFSSRGHRLPYRDRDSSKTVGYPRLAHRKDDIASARSRADAVEAVRRSRTVDDDRTARCIGDTPVNGGGRCSLSGS
jgi:hypothetical protein